MLSRSVLGLSLTGAALTAATLAQAASKHQFSVVVKESIISESANYPSPGSKVLRAGIVKGTFGEGAIVEKDRITGHPTPTTFTFNGTTTAFYSHGTFRSVRTGIATVEPNGSVGLTGDGHYVGGTGPYRGAHGRYSFTGTIPLPTPSRPAQLIAHVSGTVVY